MDIKEQEQYIDEKGKIEKKTKILADNKSYRSIVLLGMNRFCLI